MKSVRNSHERKSRHFRMKVIAASICCVGIAFAARADTEVQFNPFVTSPPPSPSNPLVPPESNERPSKSSAEASRPIRLPVVERVPDSDRFKSKPTTEAQALQIPQTDRIVDEEIREIAEVVAPIDVEPETVDLEIPQPPEESTDSSADELPEHFDLDIVPSPAPDPGGDWIEAVRSDSSIPERPQNSGSSTDWDAPQPDVPSLEAWPALNEATQAVKEPRATWLRSTTSKSTYDEARSVLDRAIMEYGVGAWASAEDSAWRSLRLIAEAIDMGQNGVSLSHSATKSAVQDLRFARTAIRESRDFLSLSDGVDPDSIKRIAMSHQTNLFDDSDGHLTACRDIGDRYLDEARIRLSRIATESVYAAEALDLLAAVYLGRNDKNLVPGPTSLCMRRAALQGQPKNASLASRLGLQLADTGLHDEAYLILTHAYELEPTVEISNALEMVASRCGKNPPRLAAGLATPKKAPTNVPEVIQLSPSEFAAISKPIIQVAATETRPVKPNENHIAGNPLPESGNGTDDQDVAGIADRSSVERTDDPPLSRLQKLKRSMTRFWK